MSWLYLGLKVSSSVCFTSPIAYALGQLPYLPNGWRFEPVDRTQAIV